MYDLMGYAGTPYELPAYRTVLSSAVHYNQRLPVM